MLVAICPLWAQDSSKAADAYIRFYQKYISEQKNSHCAMYPSCSAFGRMVFKERPFAEAITLVADRMMRCSHDAKFYDIASPHGYRSLIDYPYYHTPHRTDYPLPGTDILKRSTGREDTRLFINHLINRKEYQTALLEIVDFRVPNDIKVDGKTVIEAGSIAQGQVVRAKKNNLLGMQGELEIAVRSVKAVDGTTIYLTAGNLNDEGNNQMALSIILTFCCLFGFLIKGGNAEIPAGTQVNAMVGSNVEIDA